MMINKARTKVRFSVMGLALALALFCTAGQQDAFGADRKKKFAVKGVGTHSCSEFLAATSMGPADLMPYRNWVEGYLSATNRLTSGVYDVTPWQSGELLLTIMAGHCQKNEPHTIALVAQGIVNAFEANWLDRASRSLQIKTDTHSVQVYESIIGQTKEKLATLGYYSGKTDTTFNKETQEALSLYQVSQGLEVTGLPDPLTLFRLFQS